MGDFSGVGTSFCECLEHRINGALQAASGLANQYIREQTKILTDLSLNYVNNVLPLSALQQLQSEVKQRETYLIQQATGGFATPIGMGISQASQCIGVNLHQQINDILNTFDPSNVVNPLCDFVNRIESNFTNLVNDLSPKLDLHLGICGGNLYSTFRDSLNTTLTGLHINTVTGKLDIQSIVSDLHLSSAFNDALISVTQSASRIKKIADNILDLASMGGDDALELLL